MAQYPLPFAHRPSLLGEDFLVGSCNAEAIAWIDRWPDWPHAALMVVGPPGAGKTHLAAVFAARSGAVMAGSRTMTARSVGALANADAIILDDADGLFAGSEAETSLFHLLNRLVGTRGRLLLTARTAPARWDLSLPDLSSRLNALPMALIGAPDDSLLSALLLKQFADRQLQVGDDEIRFLVARMERSFDAARRIVDAIDRRALAEGRPITIPLLRSLLPNED